MLLLYLLLSSPRWSSREVSAVKGPVAIRRSSAPTSEYPLGRHVLARGLGAKRARGQAAGCGNGGWREGSILQAGLRGRYLGVQKSSSELVVALNLNSNVPEAMEGCPGSPRSDAWTFGAVLKKPNLFGSQVPPVAVAPPLQAGCSWGTLDSSRWAEPPRRNPTHRCQVPSEFYELH